MIELPWVVEDVVEEDMEVPVPTLECDAWAGMSENENPTMKILKGDRHLLEIEGGNAIERITEERASMQLQIDMLETEVAVLANSASTAQRHIKDLRPVGVENVIQ